jgi:hypothetical protein
MLKQTLMAIICGLAFMLFSDGASAFDDFNGKIESRPADGMGAWVIGGRTIYATEKTKLDESDGPLEVGACVEVDISQGWVQEIERDSDWRCRD